MLTITNDWPPMLYVFALLLGLAILFVFWAVWEAQKQYEKDFGKDISKEHDRQAKKFQKLFEDAKFTDSDFEHLHEEIERPYLKN